MKPGSSWRHSLLDKRIIIVAVVVATVVGGTIWLISSRADSPFIATEPDTGTFKTPATNVTDDSASNQAAVKFGMPPTSVCPTGMAHRGYHTGGKTENSVGAYKAAYDLGFEWVEADIHFTSDGKAVMMHDSTVDRTTTGSGSVSSKTLAQFKALTMNDGQKAPSLEDTLALVRNNPERKLMVELKTNPSSSARSALLAQLRGLETQVYLNSFSDKVKSLQSLKSANPAFNISMLSSKYVYPLPSGMSGETVNYQSISASNIAQLHSKGLVARTYTPNSISNWRTLKAAKIDAIITNDAPGYIKWRNGGCA